MAGRWSVQVTRDEHEIVAVLVDPSVVRWPEMRREQERPLVVDPFSERPAFGAAAGDPVSFRDARSLRADSNAPPLRRTHVT